MRPISCFLPTPGSWHFAVSSDRNSRHEMPRRPTSCRLLPGAPSKPANEFVRRSCAFALRKRDLPSFPQITTIGERRWREILLHRSLVFCHFPCASGHFRLRQTRHSRLFVKKRSRPPPISFTSKQMHNVGLQPESVGPALCA